MRQKMRERKEKEDQMENLLYLDDLMADEIINEILLEEELVKQKIKSASVKKAEKDLRTILKDFKKNKNE
jgi:hypothetical protein